LRTVADADATSSEHTLNPQTPRVKREPLLRIREKHAGAWLKHYVFPKVSKGWYVQAFSSIAYLFVAYNFALRYPVTLYITLGVVCNALDDVKQISIFLATRPNDLRNIIQPDQLVQDFATIHCRYSIHL
jgi:hypothetical protein